MAGIFKPTYTKTVKSIDPKTGEIAVRKIKRKTSKWYGWWNDHNGKKHRQALCEDKSASQVLLGNLICRAGQEKAGFIDPYEEHRKRPLADHLQDWLNSLLAKATKPRAIRTARQTYGRAQRVFAACGFKSIQDISASRVQEYIAGMRTDAPPCGGRKRAYSCSLQTMSYYLRSCKQFCRWLVKDRRHNDNPLVHLQGWNARLDRRHDRRALEREEIAWLLETTRGSTWVYRGLTGRDRFTLYAVAINSGLRASELASLTPGNFRLAENPPVIHLFAAYTKNQQEVDQPISADLTLVLQDYLACKPTGQPVWPGTWVERSARMFRHDLAEARQQWLAEVRIGDDRARREASTFLAYRDASNLVSDFHSLRHTFITLLAKSGVTPKLAQSLARHSDINLTMQRYTHVGLHDQAAALKAVPSILPAERQRSRWQEAG